MTHSVPTRRSSDLTTITKPRPSARETRMLLEIARWLSDDVRAIGVLEYITIRAVLACDTALLIGLVAGPRVIRQLTRSEEHTSELQSLMRISYAVFCFNTKKLSITSACTYP